MTTISTDNDVVTLINIFTVASPEDQQRLADVLAGAAPTMRQVDGYVSSNIHKSLDGTRVVNYAQWRSREDYEAMLKDPAAAPHLKAAADIAEKFEPSLCEVSFVDDVKDAAVRPG